MNAALTESPKKRWIEPVMAVLMSFATLAAAWSSYQSAAWTRRSNRLMNEANALERRAASLDVLFFVAMTTEFEQRRVRLVTVALALALFGFAAVRPVLLPTPPASQGALGEAAN